MKPLIFILIILLFSACRGTRFSDGLCGEWVYLKYPVIKEGYIGYDSSAQGEICFQRKWKSYIGLSKECIIELLGKPARVKKNEFIYYFGSNVTINSDDAIGVLHLYFRGGKMKKIHCSLA